jgi:hypothetical protein
MDCEIASLRDLILDIFIWASTLHEQVAIHFADGLIFFSSKINIQSG